MRQEGKNISTSLVITRLPNCCLITFFKNGEAATGGAEAVTGGVLYNKVFLKISQTLQENTCFGIFF